jgi:membrane protein YdbS with pleckstrin-like domain
VTGRPDGREPTRAYDAPRPDRTREAVVATLRPHGRALFWPSVALVLLSGATGYAVWLPVPEPWMRWAILAAGAALAVLLFLLPLLRWASRTTTVTTRRLVLRSGLVVRTRQEVLLSRATDVSVRRSGLQPLFRSGDVLVGIGGERPIRLRDLPDADLVQSALHDLMESSASVAPRPRGATGEVPRERPHRGRR